MGLAAGSVVLATKHESFHLDVVDGDDDFDVSVFASTMETVCPHFNTTKQEAECVTFIMNQRFSQDHFSQNNFLYLQ